MQRIGLHSKSHDMIYQTLLLAMTFSELSESLYRFPADPTTEKYRSPTTDIREL